MKVILHIGTEKTGTSTIQEALLQNKQVLLNAGFFYFHMPGRNEFRDFPAYCMRHGKYDRYFKLKGVVDADSRDKFDNAFLTFFANEISLIPANIHTVIISSEHFSSRLNSRAEISKVHDLLSPIFTSIKVVCYLRNPVDRICSAYSTRIKSGGVMSFEAYFNDFLSNTESSEYDRKLEIWENIFGVDSMEVRIFDHSEFISGDLLSDFFSLLPLDDTTTLTLPELRQNQSLSLIGCEIVRRINCFLPLSLRRLGSESIRLALVQCVMRLFRGRGVRLSDAQKDMIHKRFQASNERTRSRYFPSRKRLFEENL